MPMPSFVGPPSGSPPRVPGSFCDFLYTLLFLFTLAWMRLRLRSLAAATSRKVVRAADFTVFVPYGLPGVRHGCALHVRTEHCATQALRAGTRSRMLADPPLTHTRVVHVWCACSGPRSQRCATTSPTCSR